MERISVFDIFKIGVGPSSSHTMGPWKAALEFLQEVGNQSEKLSHVHVELYGSLAKTGKGHGTDVAVILGLIGHHPETIPIDQVGYLVSEVEHSQTLHFGNIKWISFNPEEDIIFYMNQTLPYHANGVRFRCFFTDETSYSATYYSIGGGFIVKEGVEDSKSQIVMPYPIDTGEDLKSWCESLNHSISEIVMHNELAIRPESQIHDELMRIWQVMKECIYTSCHIEGILPGGLNVQRRAFQMAANLIGDNTYSNVDEWIAIIKKGPHTFNSTLKWLSCFALAVNEENAAFGRIVTAPTNGAAGVIPAVLMYHVCFSDHFQEKDIITFLLTAGELGSLFKKGATISAAMGGCQAEIGVSSAMAAGALAEVLGGDFQQAMMAAEIAMEHHLGMTCDPIGGLVQIPCIERNTMGAIKAVTACQIALDSDPEKALVSLDAVIKTMKATAIDMNTKYKETADGGLALVFSVNLVEC